MELRIWYKSAQRLTPNFIIDIFAEIKDLRLTVDIFSKSETVSIVALRKESPLEN